MSERSIFLAALERDDPKQRQQYVDEACGQDADLRQRVEALLRSHEEAGSFLATPAAEQVLVAEAADQEPAQEKGSEGSTPPSGQTTETLADRPSVNLPVESLDFLAPPTKPGALGRLDHNEILEVVGRGGMGVVLKAFDDELQRIVAIKAMARQFAANVTARKRFVREARAAAAINHDNVVVIHRVEGNSPVPFLVMQFIHGASLEERLARSGPLEVKEILRIGMQTAAGLAAAHAQGLVHRDIKPANILLENSIERVKITDFGLARAVDDASVTQSGVIAGTPMYMAPEQAASQPVDHRADLFSLGSVLYALCTGHSPFRADSTMAVLMRVIEDTPRAIRELNPEIPDWLCEIIAKLHAKKPDDRFQSAKEVAELLEQHLAHLQQPTKVPPPPPPAPIPVPPARPPEPSLRPPLRTGWDWMGAILMLVVLVSVSNQLLGRWLSIDNVTSWLVLLGGIILAVALSARTIRHFWMAQRTATIMLAAAAGLAFTASGGAVYMLYAQSTQQEQGRVYPYGLVALLIATGALAAVGELSAVRRSGPPSTRSSGGQWLRASRWLLPLVMFLPFFLIAFRGTWFRFTGSSGVPITGSRLDVKWFDPDKTLDIRIVEGKTESPLSMGAVRPLNGPALVTRHMSQGDYLIRVYRGNQLVYERPVTLPGGKNVEIEIPHLPPGNPGEWASLFDGQSLRGWTQNQKQTSDWIVADGLLVGRSGQLSTERVNFENFHLWAEVQVNDGGEGGIMFRNPPADGNKSAKTALPDGYQVEITGRNAVPPNGSLIRRESGAADVISAKPVGRPNDWLAVEVIARDQLIVTKVNGRTAVQHLASDSQSTAGPIVLSAFGSNTLVRFRQLKIKELPGKPLLFAAEAPFPGNIARWHQERWAELGKRKVLQTNSIGMRMTLVPAGEFDMGTEADEVSDLNREWQALSKQAPNPNPWRVWEFGALQYEGPMYRVHISRPFYLGTNEVTVAQFRAFVKATNYKTEVETTGKGGFAWNGVGTWVQRENVTWQNPGGDWKPTDDQPVVQITRNDADRFCEWLSQKENMICRLPTEAEWEHACRAGSGERYAFGASAAEMGRFGWTVESGVNRPQPVGGKQPNPWGLFDMHGNVQEWCADGYSHDSYRSSPSYDPRGPAQRHGAVMRGGGWSNHAFMCRSASRLFTSPNAANDHTGFRVVCELPIESDPADRKLIRVFAPSASTIAKLPAVQPDDGGWRISAPRAGVVELFDVAKPDVANGTLVFRAKVRVGAIESRAFLQLRCIVDGKAIEGKNPAKPIVGATENWRTFETRLPLRPGQRPERIELNVEFDGAGTLGIRDIELIHVPELARKAP